MLNSTLLCLSITPIPLTYPPLHKNSHNHGNKNDSAGEDHPQFTRNGNISSENGNYNLVEMFVNLQNSTRRIPENISHVSLRNFINESCSSVQWKSMMKIV
jgi:hypothetical protein